MRDSGKNKGEPAVQPEVKGTIDGRPATTADLREDFAVQRNHSHSLCRPEDIAILRPDMDGVQTSWGNKGNQVGGDKLLASEGRSITGNSHECVGSPDALLTQAK